MPRESTRLRAEDLRVIYLLIGECCELGADPLVWRHHLLTTLNKYFGAVASVDIEASFDPKRLGIGAKVEMAMTLDQFTSKERDLLDRCMREMPIEANPLGVELLNSCPPQSAVASTRRERVSDQVWQRCEFMTEYFSPLGWDDMLVAIVKRSTGMRFYNFAKERSDCRFAARSARMLQLLVTEISAIPPHRLAPLGEQSLLDLPPRLREVLTALAEGDNEKQISVRLGITRSTVHEYVRRLFERFGVSSRGQLLVQAARRLHAFELSSRSSEENCWFFQSANA